MRPWISCAAIATLLLATNAGAQDAGFRAHAMSLPRLRPYPAIKWWSDAQAMAGEAPNPSHPRGTVLVIESADGQPAPALSEWDVLTGQQIRSVPLPLPSDLLHVRIVRAADRIHIVAYSRPHTELFYLRLTTALAVQSKEVLGSVDGVELKTDGSLVAILWCGTREGAGGLYGWHLVTLDTAGSRLGAAYLAADAFADGPLAVLEGKVYVLQSIGHQALPPIVRFAANAIVEAAYPLSATPDGEASLFAWGGKLLLVNGGWFVGVDWRSLYTLGGPAVPYRPEKGKPWYPYFRVSSDESGRLVTSRGDVLSPSLKVERHFASQPEAGHMPFWIGSTPALLMIDGPSGRLWIEWAE
jgi:hypothetical protein